MHKTHSTKYVRYDYETIWRMYRACRMSQREIAAEIGTDQAYVSRIVRQHPELARGRMYNRRTTNA